MLSLTGFATGSLMTRKERVNAPNFGIRILLLAE